MKYYIIIRFVDADGFVTRAINFFTNSIWPHVEIQTPDGQWVGAHAGGGVEVRPADYAKNIRRERRYAIEVTKEQYDTIWASINKDIGKLLYNFLDDLGLLIHNRELNSKDRVECSEWVFKKLYDGGILLLNVLPEYAYLITPEMLHLSSLFIGKCVYNFDKDGK